MQGAIGCVWAGWQTHWSGVLQWSVTRHCPTLIGCNKLTYSGFCQGMGCEMCGGEVWQEREWGGGGVVGEGVGGEFGRRGGCGR